MTDTASHKPLLVIHGGAGTILRENLTPEYEQQYHTKLKESLQAGFEMLQQGKSSIDAVVAAIKVMEDCPLFNAGKGSVFTADETIEMDASIMDGLTGEAGAVAGVTKIRNPITAARAVMEKSEHVLLSGPGVEQFAKAQGITLVDPSYFRDETRLKQLRKTQAKEQEIFQRNALSSLEVAGMGGSAIEFDVDQDKKFGTVGAVAIDSTGRLAAATSTGGMTNKRYGRVGDSPIIGAGTFASKTCAVSCTGHGEFFIKNCVAYDINAHMEYKGSSLLEAATYVVKDKLEQRGGKGGIIAVDSQGGYAMVMNTPGMYRGVITETLCETHIFDNE